MPDLKNYTVIIPEKACFNEKRAADFLVQNIKLVAGFKIPVKTDNTPAEDCEIVIGCTSRESEFGVSFERSRDRLWEYEVKNYGERIFLTGLGIPPEVEPPYTSAYRLIDDGAQGTVLAAYHFTEKILGYDFVWSPYISFAEIDRINISDACNFSYTKESLSKELPVLYDGAAIYSIPSASLLNWNMSCFIIKTKSDNLIVIDGGFAADTDHVLRCLEHISHGRKPEIEAWFFTHLHADHYGVYRTICENPALSERIKVKNFYHCLLSEEFYTALSKEKIPENALIRKILLDSCKTLGANVQSVREGDEFIFDEIKFEVIRTPDINDAEKMNMNDSSVVLKMTYDGNQTWLFLSDAEWIASNELLKKHADKVKSDVVQVGHHGCGSVSRECYEKIGASAYIFQVGKRFWYSDGGEGLNTHNTGIIRTRAWIKQLGANNENIYVDTNGILSLTLPIDIK